MKPVLCIIKFIILVTALLHDIYNYIPETNHVSRVYIVAAVLYIQLVLHVMLFRPWSVFCTFTLVVSIVCVQCQLWLLYLSLLLLLLLYYQV